MNIGSKRVMPFSCAIVSPRTTRAPMLQLLKVNDVWLIALYVILSMKITYVFGRDVPALQDLCARRTWSFCPGGHDNVRNNQRPPAADLPPSNSAPAATEDSNSRPSPSKPSTVEEYCKSFEPHFTYYCNGEGQKERKAEDFCSDYLNHCFALPAAGNVGAGSAAGAAGDAGAGATQPAVVPCSTYTPIYTRQCTAQVVSNPQTAQFCQNYQTYCSNRPSEAVTAPPQQADTAFALAQIKEKCMEYKTVAKLYCTGPAAQTQTQQVKRYCDLFRQYCVATGIAQLNRRRRSA